MSVRRMASARTKLITLALGVLFIGCGRCVECTNFGSSETICETEFDSTFQYQQAIDQAEANGANCVSTGGI